MNRIEFMKQLEELLRDIPVNERRDALNYYENYFEDAGAENEESIINELESPQKVAITIKKDLYGANYDAYVYMNQKENTKENSPKQDNTLRNVLIVIAIVLSSPVWLGLAGGIIGLVLGLLGGAIGIIAGLVAVVGSSLVAGCVLIGVGLVKTFAGLPAVGLVIIAAGLLLLVVFVLSMMAAVWVFGTCIPWSVRGVVRLCKLPFEKRRGYSK